MSASRCLKRRPTRRWKAFRPRSIFWRTKSPRPKQSQPKDFVDMSLLEEIEKTTAAEKR